MVSTQADIVPRDDGLYDVVSGDIVSGPFPTIAFAIRVASGGRPAPAPVARPRHFKVIQEVRRNASA